MTFFGITFPKLDGLIDCIWKPDGFDPAGNWVHRHIEYGRSLKDWHTYITTLRSPIFPGMPKSTFAPTLPPPPPYIPNTVPDAWFHREIAANMLEEWFYKNQELRWKFKTLVRTFRIRKMNQRVHGVTDLHTMDPIPAEHLVCVYDHATKSVYHFHSDTIRKILAKGLQYQYCGIPMPSYPKNPYTNMPWTVAQLHTIVNQMQSNIWRSRQKFVDQPIIEFTKANFRIPKYLKLYGHSLEELCADAFFADPSNDGWFSIYEETLVQLFDTLDIIPRCVKSFVLHRTLPKAILNRWDECVKAAWFYENYDRMYFKYDTTYSDLLQYSRTLFYTTDNWIKDELPKLRKARRVRR
jgi:hypothetical protein